ncbi:polysaccharide export outer membrane protein [Sinobacterium caligoides]|uniref:Polysaccharide export outer membrane protein n=1 Tax=Sinobacterium caligoides TaxID=933926 RepID=A0A3N2E1Z1_9GAMM|nr:polysaccharide biosynthesis/export family protein [Sinobacterium caligoides]ROS06133.1 polysaccharide export outer membrane protein [Sinobacterium caligoides]
MNMLISALLLCLLSITAYAEKNADDLSPSGDYHVNAGDVLSVFIWGEEALAREVIVRPDGFISYPLVGEVQAGGRNVGEVTDAIEDSLANYMKNKPQVTVSIVSLAGNNIYVIGKVNRPGVFNVLMQTDVAQALALAGGLNSFADEDDIKVIRRDSEGVQTAISFDYSAIRKGRDLSSNIMLRSGDVVVVP